MDDVLQADYEKLEAIGARWKALGERIQTLHNSLKSQTEELCREHWLGGGSGAFKAEMDSLVLPSLGRMADAFTLTGDVTNESAQALRDAEERSAALFR